ncbi:MAG: HAD family phosphatase [Treponema sp.]|nr:HAD family phosphatase [Treponema sp.]
MKKITAAIFDLDGTLLDSMLYWMSCAEKYLLSSGIKAKPGLSEKLFSMTMKEGADYLRKNYKVTFSDQEIFSGINSILEKAYKEEIPFKNGAESFLSELKAAGSKIALCTNTDRILFFPSLVRLNALKYFDYIFTTSELGMSKSRPDTFFKVCKEMESRKEDCWVFEDALYSIKTAFQAGLKTCGIYDETSKADSQQIKAFSTVYCNNYKEVQNYFFA